MGVSKGLSNHDVGAIGQVPKRKINKKKIKKKVKQECRLWSSPGRCAFFLALAHILVKKNSKVSSNKN